MSYAETRPSDPFSGLQILSDDAYASLGSMETVDWTAAQTKPAGWSARLPGMALALVLAAAAVTAHRFAPGVLPVGAAVLALVAGVLVRNVLPVGGACHTGCRWIVSRLIPVAVVALGAGLNLGILASDGLSFVGYIVTAVALSIAAAVALGHWLGLPARTSFLIGTGTGVCGSSAILATAPVIEAEEDEILLSVGAINLIGLPAMFLCIAVGSLSAISPLDFGVLCGATIHAVPTVAAAAFDHGAASGETATLVKLGRVAMLVPLVFATAAWWGRSSSGAATGKRKRARDLVPWFVWGFVAVSLAGTLGLIPEIQFAPGSVLDGLSVAGPEAISAAGKLLLVLAMAAIGLQVGLKSMLRTGGRAVVLSTAVWVVLAGAIGLGVWLA